VTKGRLEINRKDSAKAANPPLRVTGRTARAAPPAPQLPGEKAVQPTDATVPVAPKTPELDAPLAPEAVDQRRQIIGTDEP
jgi:hypothetical protein